MPTYPFYLYYDWLHNNPHPPRLSYRDWNKIMNMKERQNQRIARAIRTRIHAAVILRKKVGHTLELLGCTIEECRAHLEKQFQPGMTWWNYGFYGWHIDHRKPCASFDLADPAQQRKCFNYKNLQPLWAEDNWHKHAKLNWRRKAS